MPGEYAQRDFHMPTPLLSATDCREDIAATDDSVVDDDGRDARRSPSYADGYHRPYDFGAGHERCRAFRWPR